MINRRDFATSIGLGTIGVLAASAGGSVSAATTPKPAPVTPPKGPWTGFGQIQRAGGILHYAEIGPKDSAQPPIILLHKLGGWLSDWRFVAPALAEGRRVIAFDLPGHGGSRWDGAPPYIQTLGETAALVAGALDEMGIAQVDLVGTSLGGCLSVPLAGSRPEKIRKLALVSCALNIGHDLAYIKENIDLKQQGTLYDAKGYPVPTPPELLVQIFGLVNPQQINDEGILSRRAAGLWIQPQERGVGLADLQALLRRVETPTLLLYGEKDKAYIRFEKAASAALKTSQTRYVPNSGAFVMQDNPPETARILKEFLQA